MFIVTMCTCVLFAQYSLTTSRLHLHSLNSVTPVMRLKPTELLLISSFRSSIDWNLLLHDYSIQLFLFLDELVVKDCRTFSQGCMGQNLIENDVIMTTVVSSDLQSFYSSSNCVLYSCVYFFIIGIVLDPLPLEMATLPI